MADSRLAQLMKHDDSARKRTEADSVVDVRQHPLVAMQKAVGNAAVARMIERQEEEGMAGEGEEMMATHDPALQRQEEEEEMQAKHDPDLQRQEEEEEMQAKHDPALQRQEEEEMMAKHDGAAPAVGLEGGPVGEEISSSIAAERGNGSPLDGGVREKMEGAFGTSFEGVRVHTGETSDALNRQVTAKAFTTGNDIFLRSDTSPGDEKLVAHELTHVVQQRSMGGSGDGMQVGPAGSDHEQEADAVAHEVTSGASVQRHANEEQ